MFKRSRRKIVAAIMSVLVLLWVGTLSVIYASSYFNMRNRNEAMLQAHAELYTLSQKFEELMPPERPRPEGEPNRRPAFDPDSPSFQLSTFYTVAIADGGEILEIENEPPTVHTDAELTELARGIVSGGKTDGTKDNLAFHKTDKGGYTLVTFMDNTVLNENAVTLLRYTLLFGGLALLLFFFLSVLLARKIVDPLEKSYQKQKQFISDAGHELKTPVAVVNANAELLSREIGENQWLRNIQYENERMATLVGQLLELARTESVKPQTERLDLSRLVNGEALPFESVAFEQGLQLRESILPDLQTDGNSTQLKQLVSILLDNAIRHGAGGRDVWLSLTKEHGCARLSVVNVGDEIPAEQRENLFERFYRADEARNGEDKHYGLGLAIAKAIAEAHGGSIEVLCHDGLVEFRVRLPLA